MPWLTKTILLPCDFAGSSKKAGDVGVELAQRLHVPLLLLHVFPAPTATYSGVPYVPSADYLQLVEDSARAALRGEAARLAGRGVEVRTLLKMGSPWEEIVQRAKEPDIGMILMGTHGRHGLPRALLGSVAEKVVRLSPVPVLTVHAEAEEDGTSRAARE
jgi:nucleotide-binding universal stress UspA family protein